MRRARSRHGHWSIVAFVMIATIAAMPLGRAAADPTPPDTFSVVTQGMPVLVHEFFPAVLALQVDAGLAVSTIHAGVSNTVVESSPGYVPVAGLLAANSPLPGLIGCVARHPGEPAEANCGGPAQAVGPFDVDAASGHAAATAPGDDAANVKATAATAVASATSTSNAPVGLGIGDAKSAASTVADAGRRSAGASSMVGDIDIAGVLAIRSVRSSVTAAAGGTPGTAAFDHDFTVEGATVAGQAVTIDGGGVHALGQSTSLADPQEQVNQALQAAGITVTLMPATEPTVQADGTAVAGSAGGLLVRLTNEQSGADLQFVFARSTVTLNASRSGALSAGDEPAGGPLIEGDALPDPVIGADVPGVADIAPEADIASPASPPLASAKPPPAAPEPGKGAGRPSTVRFDDQELREAVTSRGWRAVYPWFALLGLSLPLLSLLRNISFTRS